MCGRSPAYGCGGAASGSRATPIRVATIRPIRPKIGHTTNGATPSIANLAGMWSPTEAPVIDDGSGGPRWTPSRQAITDAAVVRGDDQGADDPTHIAQRPCHDQPQQQRRDGADEDEHHDDRELPLGGRLVHHEAGPDEPPTQREWRAAPTRNLPRRPQGASRRQTGQVVSGEAMGAQQLFQVSDQRGRLCHTQAVVESHDLGRAVADQAQVHLGDARDGPPAPA